MEFGKIALMKLETIVFLFSIFLFCLFIFWGVLINLHLSKKMCDFEEIRIQKSDNKSTGTEFWWVLSSDHRRKKRKLEIELMFLPFVWILVEKLVVKTRFICVSVTQEISFFHDLEHLFSVQPNLTQFTKVTKSCVFLVTGVCFPTWLNSDSPSHHPSHSTMEVFSVARFSRKIS